LTNKPKTSIIVFKYKKDRKMFNQNQQRIGFACKIQSELGKAHKDLNTKSTTITYLRGLERDAAYAKLYGIAKNNMTALLAQIKWVAQQPAHLRMFRISSDILPAYTHDDYTWVYFDPDMVKLLESGFAAVGELARAHDIKLSFHPAQYCVLASDNPGVVENSIYEFEYHCDMIRYMGYGQQFQDFKCNVHVGGKRGPDGIKAAMRSLSSEARNTLTIENAEFTWGLAASLELVDTCALVLDIHHHWIYSGEYIEPTDARFQRVVDSWRGVRPTIHYSVSREEHVPTHDVNMRPDLAALKASGLTSAKLRAHSDMYWNRAVNSWAGSFLPYADIMCESKEKNIASFAFAEQVYTL
jgi:UV DNA damage repair endonuclease